ncbi:MAG: hypothetical protein QXI56_08280 [Candidatus Bathyarchaeia archaeon]
MEEDFHSKELLKQMFPTHEEERTIRIPLLLKLADVDLEDLQIIELVDRGLSNQRTS